MYNETSNYPNAIDDLIFYQDADIDKLSAIQKYSTYIEAENYDSAYSVRDTNELHCLNAELINMFINRIKNTQEHLLTKQKKEGIYFETDRPENTSHGTIWISQRNEV